MIENLTVDDFIPWVGQIFVIRLDSGETYELVLDKVLALGNAPRSGGRSPFSLEFTHHRKDAYLPQQIYPIEHPGLGALELFLVPLGPDTNGMRYEAVFN